MKRRKMRSREEWERIVKEQAESGVAVAEFCGREDVGKSSFYHWKRRLVGGFEGEAALSGGSFIDMGRVAVESSASGGGELATVHHGVLVVTMDMGNGASLTIERR